MKLHELEPGTTFRFESDDRDWTGINRDTVYRMHENSFSPVYGLGQKKYRLLKYLYWNVTTVPSGSLEVGKSDMIEKAAREQGIEVIKPE